MAIMAKIHDAVEAIPTDAVVIGALTLPWWRVWLAQVSETTALIAPIIGVGLAAFKVWEAWRERRNVGDASMGLASSVAASAKAGSKAMSGGLIVGVLAALGVFALFNLFASGKASAAPAAIVSQQPSRAPRKRAADDDGGEDAEDSAELPDGAPVWMQTARSLIGTDEKIRGRNNPVVVAMYAKVGHAEVKNTSVPWCAAFVGAMLEEQGFTSTRSLLARSYLKWGIELPAPRPGCVVVLRRPVNGADDGFSGHVGFFLSETPTTVTLLGGNQADSVCVRTFNRKFVLGYRWPRSLAKSKTVQAAALVKVAALGGAGTAVKTASDLPDEPAQTGAERTAEQIDKAHGMLQTVGDMLPHGSKLGLYIAAGCCLLAAIGAAIVIYNRIQIRNDTGR